MSITPRFLVAQFTDLGGRDTQEDAVAYQIGTKDSYNPLKEKGALFVVADGVGGSDAGEIASNLATQLILKHYYGDSARDVLLSLKRALELTNAAILKRATEPKKSKMATTVVCVVVRGAELYVVHVGDSRAYLLADGKCYQLTRDHSWLEDQIEQNLMTRAQAEKHPSRNIIVRALGTHAGAKPDVLNAATLGGAGRLLLCTDGLYDTLEPRELALLMAEDTPESASQSLVARALANGGTDNVSALVVDVRYAEVEGPTRVVDSAVLIADLVGDEPLAPQLRPGRVGGAEEEVVAVAGVEDGAEESPIESEATSLASVESTSTAEAVVEETETRENEKGGTSGQAHDSSFALDDGAKMPDDGVPSSAAGGEVQQSPKADSTNGQVQSSLPDNGGATTSSTGVESPVEVGSSEVEARRANSVSQDDGLPATAVAPLKEADQADPGERPEVELLALRNDIMTVRNEKQVVEEKLHAAVLRAKLLEVDVSRYKNEVDETNLGLNSAVREHDDVVAKLEKAKSDVVRLLEELRDVKEDLQKATTEHDKEVMKLEAEVSRLNLQLQNLRRSADADGGTGDAAAGQPNDFRVIELRFDTPPNSPGARQRPKMVLRNDTRNGEEEMIVDWDRNALQTEYAEVLFLRLMPKRNVGTHMNVRLFGKGNAGAQSRIPGVGYELRSDLEFQIQFDSPRLEYRVKVHNVEFAKKTGFKAETLILKLELSVYRLVG